MHLLQIAQNEFRQALTGVVADPETYVAMVRPTQDPKHGDYQANFAMGQLFGGSSIPNPNRP